MNLLREKMATGFKTIYYSPCRFIFGACYPLNAQTIDATIAAYADTYSPERTYLHYDKSAYTAGETIWFKAYLMSEIVPARLKVKTFISTGSMIKAP